MSDIKESITGIVLKVSGDAVLDTDADYDRPLREIGVDSLDVMSILLEVQEKLGVTIPDEDVDGLGTVNAVIRYVAERRAA